MSEAASLEIFPEYQTLVASLEKPMLKICKELKSDFEKGNYGIIVGDDTSGRFPTLAMKGFSDYISIQNDTEKLPAVFLQSGIKVKDEDVLQQFNERVLPYKDGLDGKKALIVTDYIQSGRGINRLIGLFNSLNLSFDIAVLMISDKLDQSKLNIPQASKVCVGEISPLIPSVWKRPALTGLERANESPDRRVNVTRGDMFTRRSVMQARGDINLLVTRLVNQIYPKT